MLKRYYILFTLLILTFEIQPGLSGTSTIPKSISLNFRNSLSDSTKTDSWFGRDKGLHLVGSLIGTTLSVNVNIHEFNVKQRTGSLIGAGVVLSIGLLKETIDSKQVSNKFSWKDLAADVAGILIGLAIMEIK